MGLRALPYFAPLPMVLVAGCQSLAVSASMWKSGVQRVKSPIERRVKRGSQRDILQVAEGSGCREPF